MLLGSAVLEIAIGLAFLYLLLALVCSTVNEWIAGLFKLRAKTLREGIGNLLEDPEMTGLAKRFYEHPLVKGLSRKGDANLPSYIAADTFAIALIDILLPNADSTQPQNLLDVYQDIRVKLAGYASGNSELAKTVLLLLDRAGVDPAKLQEAGEAVRQLEQVRQQLTWLAQQVDSSNLDTIQPLSESLKTFQELESSLKQAEAQLRYALVEAQGNVERFYDQSMERVSGWYKRRAQAIIIVIAMLVAALFNADSLAIANRLAVDPILRAEIADAAQDYVAEAQASAGAQAQAAIDSVDAAGSVLGSSNAISPTAGITGTTSLTRTASLPGDSVARLDRLETEYGLPLGWHGIPQDMEGWLYKIAGLLLTVVAVSLGAPFWFDLLNKLVNLRMSGKVPAETKQPFQGMEGTILAAKIGSQRRPVLEGFPRSAAPPLTLDALARQALTYVEDLKARNVLKVAEMDAAVAWMLVTTTEQGIPATSEEIVAALNRCLQKK